MKPERISITRVENEIEKYAETYGKYPSVIEMNAIDFDIFEPMVIKEASQVGIHIPPGKVEKFRGCKIKVNNLYSSKLKVY